MRFAAALLLTAFLAGCASTDDVARHDNFAPGSPEFDIQSTVYAVYNVLSGPAGRRDWDRFEELFAPSAVIVSSSSRDGARELTRSSTKEFVEHWKPIFNEKGWFERPVAMRIERYGDIAQVWSTYEGRETSNQEKPSARGIDSFQMVRIGSDWKVQSLVWQEEDASAPIPAQYLSSR